MEISEYKNIFENESTHFYYVGTHNLTIKFLVKYLSKKGTNKILDAGCGTGALIIKMSKFGKVWGIDASSEALKFTKRNGLKKIKKGSVTKIPFNKNTFDAVVSVDVLYHKNVENDQRALEEFYRVLKPGGILIIKNPAHNWLRGSHDIIIHTKRRYNKEKFKKKVNKAGFQIIRLSYINISFLPLAILKRLTESLMKSKPSSDVGKLPKMLNNLLINIYNAEIKILETIDIPAGLSLFTIARKPLTIS